jgi:heme-degrading monooxygenase HmoA
MTSTPARRERSPGASVARTWSARASRATAPRYAEHLREAVLPHVRSLPGYEGATLLQRDEGDEVEILVITWWRSLEDIRGFAGKQLEHAVIAEEARALLEAADENVRHFRVAHDERTLAPAVDRRSQASTSGEQPGDD